MSIEERNFPFTPDTCSHKSWALNGTTSTCQLCGKQKRQQHLTPVCGSAPMFPSVGKRIESMACVEPAGHDGPHRDAKGVRRL